MLNVNLLDIKRIISHNIIAKKQDEEHATAQYSDELIQIDHANMDDVVDTLKNRITQGIGAKSKSYQMDIEKTEEGSLYNYLKDLSVKEDDDFIAISKNIADILAESQTRSSYNSGFLVLLECTKRGYPWPIFILLKAEPHSALKVENIKGHNFLTLLKEIILSPSQDLFKIGFFYDPRFDMDDEEMHAYHNGQNQLVFTAVFSDLQVNSGGKPAEYFYNGFLGLSADNCGKLQTKNFYDKTEKFIRGGAITSSIKIMEYLSILKTYLNSAATVSINIQNFSENFPHEGGIRDSYKRAVEDLPNLIMKDTLQIQNKLKNRNISFNSKIKIQGPEDGFDEEVFIVSDNDALQDLDAENGAYTIIKIKGQPFIASNDN